SVHLLVSFSLSVLTRRPPSSTLFPYTTLFRSALAVTSATAGLIAADPHDTPYFRRTARFEGFNKVFSGRNTSAIMAGVPSAFLRSEEHTSELQSRFDLVCRLLLEKKKNTTQIP